MKRDQSKRETAFEARDRLKLALLARRSVGRSGGAPTRGCHLTCETSDQLTATKSSVPKVGEEREVSCAAIQVSDGLGTPSWRRISPDPGPYRTGLLKLPQRCDSATPIVQRRQCAKHTPA